MSSGQEERNWVSELRSSDQARDRALADLRRLLLSGLKRSLSGLSKRDFAESMEDFVQEALLKILKNLDSFQGKSRFTTWAFKIAVRVALSELRRKRWKDVSLDSLMSPEGSGALFQSKPGSGPELTFMRSEVMSKVHLLMWDELTEKQRRAMHAIVLGGMPMEEVSSRMGMNRNALYKLLHDGRKKLKSRMMSEGMKIEEMMAVFEGG